MWPPVASTAGPMLTRREDQLASIPSPVASTEAGLPSDTRIRPETLPWSSRIATRALERHRVETQPAKWVTTWDGGGGWGSRGFSWAAET
jgi:hypothetical protein